MRARTVAVPVVSGAVAEALRYGLMSAWHAGSITDGEASEAMKLVDRIDAELQA